MSVQQPQPQPRYKTVAAWVLVVLLIPIAAASLGFVYAIYLGLTTGRLNTVAKGFRASSSTVSFAESPISFSVFLLLTAALAATFIIVTFVLARLAIRHLRTSQQKHSPRRAGDA
jgi:hypothetical protein